MRQWLIEKRNKKNLSQKILAESCGISQQTYSAFEIGTRRPRPETAMKLGKLLGFNWTLFYMEKSFKDAG